MLDFSGAAQEKRLHPFLPGLSLFFRCPSQPPATSARLTPLRSMSLDRQLYFDLALALKNSARAFTSRFRFSADGFFFSRDDSSVVSLVSLQRPIPVEPIRRAPQASPASVLFETAPVWYVIILRDRSILLPFSSGSWQPSPIPSKKHLSRGQREFRLALLWEAASNPPIVLCSSLFLHLRRERA